MSLIVSRKCFFSAGSWAKAILLGELLDLDVFRQCFALGLELLDVEAAILALDQKAPTRKNTRASGLPMLKERKSFSRTWQTSLSSILEAARRVLIMLRLDRIFRSVRATRFYYRYPGFRKASTLG
jgi:hypothetical protein